MRVFFIKKSRSLERIESKDLQSSESAKIASPNSGHNGIADIPSSPGGEESSTFTNENDAAADDHHGSKNGMKLVEDDPPEHFEDTLDFETNE